MLSIFLLSLCGIISAQKKSAASEITMQSNQLAEAIKRNDLNKQAEIYIEISNSYFNQSNLIKSEENLRKAQIIYGKNGNKDGLAVVSRKLAQIQESQNKTKKAADNYERAAILSQSESQKTVNRNDLSRVASKSLETKEKAVQENISLNEYEANSGDLAKDYNNLADINLQQNNSPKAVENLTTAYELTKKNQQDQAIIINQKMTDLYVENKNFDKAIETKKEVLKEEFIIKDSRQRVIQIQELAKIYLQKNDVDEAVELYKMAYDISLENQHTFSAIKSVEKLDSLYLVSGNTDLSLSLYKDFLSNLPNLVSNDSELVDSKILEQTEGRIALLEKEKQLKDELIRKKNIFNYVLIAALFLLCTLIFFIIKTLKKVQIKNKKIALQSLRREMNPHFIFNSLNSVNQFIATNNELEANQYLTKFSKLMRGVMENSTEDFIPFMQELDLLNNYLSLEKTRFTDKFEYKISIDEHLNTQNLQLPGMLIQPFLENAIWHGLRYKSEKGFLKLNFQKEKDALKITIADNGIGIEESKKQKTAHQKNQKGRGMKNTLERIKLLNDLYKRHIICKVIDSKFGVVVEITINC